MINQIFKAPSADEALVKALSSDYDIVKAAKRAGLVQRRVQVDGPNGPYEAMRWVDPSEDPAKQATVQRESGGKANEPSSVGGNQRSPKKARIEKPVKSQPTSVSGKVDARPVLPSNGAGNTGDSSKGSSQGRQPTGNSKRTGGPSVEETGKEVSAADYVIVINEWAKRTDKANLDTVDIHTEQELKEMGAKSYIGLGYDAEKKPSGYGAAVKPDGDIIGVFSGVKGKVKDSMMWAIEQGGKKLDAYAVNTATKDFSALPHIYHKYGFVPVARVKFNGEYATPGFEERQNGPLDIVVYMHNGDPIETVKSNYGKYPGPTMEQYDKLPVMEYDDAINYRNEMIDTLSALEDKFEETSGSISRSKLRTQINAIKAGYGDDVEAYKKFRDEKLDAEKKERETKLKDAETARQEATKQAKSKEIEDRKKQVDEDVKSSPKEKVAQWDIIKNSNPMQDDYHVGIRSPKDIKTFDEVVNNPDDFAWGDFSREDAQKALKRGSITIYSSYPIEQGVFVSTSQQQAQEYAGGKGGKIYKKNVPLDSVAWINGDEGQFADTKKSNFNMFKKGDDANKALYDSAYKKWSSSLSKEQEIAIKSYCMSAYVPVNEYLRGIGDDDATANRFIPQLDKAIEQYTLSQDISVSRAASISTLPGLGIDANNLEASIGEEIVFPEYLSTSVVEGAYKPPENSVNITMDIPAGKGRGAYVNELSSYKDSEYEFLLARESEFKVIAANKKNGKINLTLEMIDNG